MGRVFALSDLHGRGDLFQQILNFLKEDDVVYFLGDAGDRGPNGWEIIKTIINDSRFIYIKGNHEDMLQRAMDDYIHYDGMCDDAFNLLCYNGGYDTFIDWSQEGAKPEWSTILKNLPTYKIYVNTNNITIHLSHAGFSPPDIVDLLWNRFHIQEEWIGEDDEIIVHGHTPAHHINESAAAGALWYCDGHKCCIDTGAVWTGIAVLLDLNTFDEEIFIGKPMR